MSWEEGQSWTCSHCGRECIIQRGVPMDMVTRKRHTCEAYKKYIKAQPKVRQGLSELFAAHSEDRGGKLVEVPSPGSGRWVRQKWRSETKKIMREGQEITVQWGYMTDEVYQANKNMSLFLATYQKPMSEYFITFDRKKFDYKGNVKRGVWGL